MSRYALVVGIGQYQQLGKLSKPKADAQAVCDLLRRHGNFNEVHTLLDAEATYESLVERLEYVLLKQGDRAEVLLYFTGHGFTAGRNKRVQQGYLATYDCKVKQDREGNVTYVEDALSFQELNALIEEAKPAQLAMLLDCCHSDFFVEQSLIGKGLSGFGDRGYFLSAACRSYEKAWANKNENHSVYTGALLQALQGEQVQEITASEAHNLIQRRLRGSGQQPISFGYGESLALVPHQGKEDPGPGKNCPYQGLQAFQSETAQFFFGRDEDKRRLWERLQKSNFVAMLGPSGSGKSSVVRAGLTKRLEDEEWQVLTMKPGLAPMASLKDGLLKLCAERNVAEGEKRQLFRVLDTAGLGEMVQQMAGDDRFLLVVDQFEEVFTQCGRDDQQRFIGELLKVREMVDPRLVVVVTMRSDFVNEWLALGYPADVIEKDVVWLGPLKGENLRDAILKPAHKQGYDFGEGLLDLLLADVADESNCLPLLEFALTELWEKRDTTAKKLTASAYREMGGLKGALNKRAETVYNSFREIDKPWAKRVCLRLVRLGEDEKDTRQRQLKRSLLAMGGPEGAQNEQQQQTRQMIAYVIQDLVIGRLLVVDGEFVDLAHEALLDGWQRFVTWRQADRDLRRLVQRLADEYENWKKAKESDAREEDDYLLTGGLLAEVREQQEVLSKKLEESRPALMKYFADSDRKDAETVAVLQQALADANMQAMSLKVRDKLLNNPSQTVDVALSAMALVNKSQQDFQGDVVPAAQDALHRAWFKIRERLRMEGHRSSVASVAFSPQGDCIVSGSWDNTLRLWDLQGNAIGLPFKGHTGSVLTVAFSPQGDRIVSSGDEGTLRLWDPQGNAIGVPFKGHSGLVSTVAFSPQGDLIISGGHDGTLRLWDLNGNAIGLPFEGHGSPVHSVAFSPQGDLIISGGRDNTLRLWDLNGDAIGLPFEGHDSWVYSVAFNPQGDRIVSGGRDNTLRLWDLNGNAIGSPFEGHSGSVYSVAFSPGGDYIASSGGDNTLRLWNLEGNAIGSPFAGHSDFVASVAFSPKGDCIVSGSHDNALRLWALKENSHSTVFEGHIGWAYSVAFSPKGNHIVSSGGAETIQLWDLEGQSVDSPFGGHRNSKSVHSVAFSPRGYRIVSGANDGTLKLWDLKGNVLVSAFKGHSGPVTSVAFSPQGDLIVSGSRDKTLRLWDLEGNAIGVPFEGHSAWVYSVAFSPLGDCIVSGGRDKTLRLWDLEGNAIGAPFEGHSGWIRSVAFNPQGDCIVSGGDDKMLRLWDLEGNAVGSPFEGHSDWVYSVAFSPQGDRIVSGSRDKTLRLWDLDGNTIGAPYEGHGDWVYSVAFSPQGDRIVSGSRDKTLRLWRVGTWEDELRYCCNTLMHHTVLTLPQDETAHQACEVCERVWTRQQSAQFAVAQGSALARQGDVEGAVRKFDRAKGLDPELVIDSVGRARELAEWG